MCELCKIDLPSRKDCGLKDVFLTLKYAAYKAKYPPSDLACVGPEKNSRCEDIRRNKVLADLPFDLPALMRSDNVPFASFRNKLHFQRFVWRRAKVRAVRSLIVSVRKQLSYVAEVQSEDGVETVDHYFNLLLEEWQQFIAEFIPCIRDGYYTQQPCGHCRRRFSFPGVAAICLDCDGFPLFCRTFTCDPMFSHGLAAQHQSIQIDYECVNLGDSGRFEEVICHGLVAVIKQLIIWYIDNALACGLGFTIPASTAAVQRALDAIPEKYLDAIEGVDSS